MFLCFINPTYIWSKNIVVTPRSGYELFIASPSESYGALLLQSLYSVVSFVKTAFEADSVGRARTHLESHARPMGKLKEVTSNSDIKADVSAALTNVYDLQNVMFVDT